MASSEKTDLQNFHKRIQNFSHFFPQYKKIVKVAHFIDELLTPEQRKMLQLEHGGEVWDFKTQMLLHFEYRYHDWTYSLDQVKEYAEAAFKKYKFLFETNLPPEQIRTILLRELMEVISIGSQCFRYKRFFANSIYRIGHLWRGGMFSSHMRYLMLNTYANLPARRETILRQKHTIPFKKEIFGPDLHIAFVDESTQDLWIEECFKKTKWCFEYLNFSGEREGRKYKEKLYQEINFCRLRDKNWYGSAWWLLLLKLNQMQNNAINRERYTKKQILTNTNLHLRELVDEVLEHFDEGELEKLSRIDAEEKVWTFKEQLLDRYYSKHPSLASLEEAKRCAREKLLQYKPLLANAAEIEVWKEMLLDELEKDLFISLPTHIWNEEMMKNVKASKNQTMEKGVVWAINQIVALIKCDNLEIEGVQYDLKNLLTARWKRTWLAQGKKAFSRKLIYAFVKLGVKREMTPIDLQMFLGEMDSCFLYPNQFRKARFFARKDDTGDLSKLGKNIIDRSDEFINVCSAIIFVIVAAIVIVIGWHRKNRFSR